MGCGKEIAPGTSRTPGWKIKNKDEIENDTRGFNKISLRRNHNKLLQTSLYSSVRRPAGSCFKNFNKF
jgi:hypothetical protein